MLIIGASGFVGRYLFSYARAENQNVLGTQSKLNLPGLIKFDVLHQRIKDCIPISYLKNNEKSFAIIAIKFGSMDGYIEGLNQSYKFEIERINLLINDLLNMGLTPVYISTNAVFDGKTGFYSEKEECNPISLYGNYMAEIERVIKSYEHDTLVLRLSNVVGDNPGEKHLFSDWYNCIKKNTPIYCIDGQTLSPTYVHDVAKSVYLGCKGKLKGIYHITNTEHFQRSELANLFKSLLGRKIPVINKTEKELGIIDPRPIKGHLNSSKFIEATKMKYTPMRNVINRFKSNIDYLF